MEGGEETRVALTGGGNENFRVEMSRFLRIERATTALLLLLLLPAPLLLLPLPLLPLLLLLLLLTILSLTSFDCPLSDH